MSNNLRQAQARLVLDCEFLTKQAIRRQLAAMPNESYLIRLIHSVRRRPAPGQRLWTAQELAGDHVVCFLRAHNRLGFNVYLWPYAERRNAGYIFLDLDHAPTYVLEDMRIHGHEPCVVLETSPGHLQAWVRVSTTPLEPALATTLGRILAERYGGDRASTDWRHLGRLAGFSNLKPAICALTGVAPTVQIVHAEPVLASAAQLSLDAAHEWLEQFGSKAPAIMPPVAAIGASSRQTPEQRGAGVPRTPITREGAVAVYQRWVQRWRIRERFPPPDWSVVDLWLASKLLAQHTPPAQVMEILRLGSPDFPRDHGDPEDYLRRTLARAAPSSPRPVSGETRSDIRTSVRRA
ncbi:MAG TPA: DNA-primase RepB domain-containing protein [Candidatus Sulfotelmatobacter sp.]|nr:DNA-primase RepB domain-containing protein [Candidatus Sulfotelmatobacter sp.]